VLTALAIAADQTHQASHQDKPSSQHHQARSLSKNFLLPCPRPFYSLHHHENKQQPKKTHLARLEQQQVELAYIFPRLEFVLTTGPEQKRTRAQPSNVTKSNFFVPQNKHTAMRNTAHERRFDQEKKKLTQEKYETREKVLLW
jgi:hypothetical protein